VDGLSQLDMLRRRKMLHAVSIIGSVASLTAVGILAVLHLLVYAPAAVGILAGLHLQPLATVFRVQAMRMAGWLLVAWCAMCLLLHTHIALFSAMGELVLLGGLAAMLMLRKRPVLA
jgi:hypothetical protein